MSMMLPMVVVIMIVTVPCFSVIVGHWLVSLFNFRNI
jgi:hypothetical protein